jgi:uncharacterized membrane protein
MEPQHHSIAMSIDMVEATKRTIGLMGWLGLIGCLAAIGAGVFMVYVGSTGTSEVALFGQTINTTSVGVACVFLGIVALVLVVRSAFKALAMAIAAPPEPQRGARRRSNI